MPPKADIEMDAALRLLMTQSGHSALLTNVVADDATGEAYQDRRIVRHGRYVTFQLAEVAIPRTLSADILRRIDRLRPKPLPT